MTLEELRNHYETLVTRKNTPDESWYNGIYTRYTHPILTAEHAPLEWRFDLDPQTNPHLLERMGVNAVFNAGAMEKDGKILLVTRMEGDDRKSFFAIAESENGIDNFRFWPEPVVMPETDDPDTNVYDMRLTEHEDGWIYGLFCTERKDTGSPDLSAAIAQCGIARTRDLKTWERLPDLKSPSPQQRNVVLHPEFVDGKYFLYTRPQDSFIEAGSGGGIGYGFSNSMENPEVTEEKVLDHRLYHTIKEAKNGQGPAPIKTHAGWLHLAHGVRPTAAGLRYVLYMFMTDLDKPWQKIHEPAGHFLGPIGQERVGDVSNVAFSNGWVARDNGEVFIYYASSDTRMHVATSSIEKLVDYCRNTPEDPLTSAKCVQQRIDLIHKNKNLGT